MPVSMTRDQLAELSLVDFSLYHYLKGITTTGEQREERIVDLLKSDFPDGDILSVLQDLSGLSLSEIGLYFYWLSAQHLMGRKDEGKFYKGHGTIFARYFQDFPDSHLSQANSGRQRAYYLKHRFVMISQDARDRAPTHRRNELAARLLMGREQLQAA